MKEITLIFSIIAISIVYQAQTNLVINPGFEQTNYTYTGTRELNRTGYLSNYWYVPLKKRSPHLFMTPERSVAKAFSGYNAIGMTLGDAKAKKSKIEYITGELSSPLEAGQVYCVSFYMLLHRSSKWAASNIGVLFHHDKKLISNVNNLNELEASLYANNGEYVTSTKWIEFNGYYVASGGEKHITFGAFGETASVEIKEIGMEPYFQLDGFKKRAFYQLDEVAVVAKDDGVDCGCATPPKTEEINYTDDLTPYLFTLDASGSMKKGGVFDTLRSNLIDLLKQLPLGTPVTFSTFSSSSNIVYTGKLGSDTPKEVDTILAAIRLKGGTNVFSGLDKAAKSWESTGKDSARIVLISDGSFPVTNKIENLVKEQFENKGRRLTVIQIASKAKGAERLEPYQTSFLQVNLSELKNALFQVYEPKKTFAIKCPCNNVYTDTMNYHFVIDYSGSMKFHRNRAKKAVLNLYEQAPPTAVISITAFSLQAKQLYSGKKSNLSMIDLENLLEAHVAQGGTNPAPGVEHGLNIAHNMAAKRFSHMIIVTDLEPEHLNINGSMVTNIMSMSSKFDLAVSAATVDLESQLDLLVSGRSQFDFTTKIFRKVSKAKFEKDLFDTKRSACDYTTQPYHYNPAGDFAKEASKKGIKLLIKKLFGVSLTLKTG